MARNIFVSFDVDGTMVLYDTIEAHMSVFRDAVAEVAQRPCGFPSETLGYDVDGMMDRRILSLMLEKLDCPSSPENVERVEEIMQRLFQDRMTAIANVPAGVKKVLETLMRTENVTIGVASGNLPGIAWKKLENAGLLEYFPDRIGGFGIVADRKTAVRRAREIAEEKKGLKFDVVVHVGDTCADIEAALANGEKAVAVRTGLKKNLVYPEPCLVLNNLDEGFDDFISYIGL